MTMCIGCIASAGVFWLHAEIMNAVMEGYFPGRPMRRFIYLLQSMFAILPCLGFAYIGWRMHLGVRDGRMRRYERRSKVGSVWSFFAFVAAVLSWGLPVFAIFALLNAM